MKKIIRKKNLVLILLTLFISCNNDDNLAINDINNPINAKIEFKPAKGLDIEVIGISDEKEATYEWEVTDKLDPKGQRYQATNNEGKTSLGWGPRLGSYKIYFNNYK